MTDALAAAIGLDASPGAWLDIRESGVAPGLARPRRLAGPLGRLGTGLLGRSL